MSAAPPAPGPTGTPPRDGRSGPEGAGSGPEVGGSDPAERRGPRLLYALVIGALVVEIVLLRALTVHFR